VVQGKDEAATKQFAQLGLEVLAQELARQEAKDRVEKGSYRDVETVHVGNDLHAAVAGTATLGANNEKSLHAALDRHLDGKARSMAEVKGVADAGKLLPPGPLATLWLDLDAVKAKPGAKEVFAQPRNDQNLTVLFGGWLDVARRSPYLCAG